MASPSLKDLRDQAAEPVIERLREHREEIEELEQVLFDQLEAHLFDPELTGKSWHRACRQTSGWAIDMIEETVGTTPASYLEELRVETAMRLFQLVGEEVANAEVGVAVGYHHAGAFGRAFARHCHQTPAAYRRELQRLRAQGAELPDPSWIRSRLFQTLSEGRRELEKLLAMVDSIQEGRHDARMATPEQRTTLRRAALLSSLAELVLPNLRVVSLDDALRVAVLGARTENPGLCEHLLEQSRQMASTDPELGVRLAELAIRHAATLKPHLGPAPYAHLLARAWAWLGDARRQALDPGGAAEAFERAEGYLGLYPPPPVVVSEILAIKSALNPPAETDEIPASWRPN